MYKSTAYKLSRVELKNIAQLGTTEKGAEGLAKDIEQMVDKVSDLYLKLNKEAETLRRLNAAGEKYVDQAKEVANQFEKSVKELGMNPNDFSELSRQKSAVSKLVNVIEGKGYKVLKKTGTL